MFSLLFLQEFPRSGPKRRKSARSPRAQSPLISELRQFNGSADLDIADHLAQARILRLDLVTGERILQRLQAVDREGAGKQAMTDRFQLLQQLFSLFRRCAVAASWLVGINSLQRN